MHFQHAFSARNIRISPHLVLETSVEAHEAVHRVAVDDAVLTVHPQLAARVLAKRSGDLRREEVRWRRRGEVEVRI